MLHYSVKVEKDSSQNEHQVFREFLPTTSSSHDSGLAKFKDWKQNPTVRAAKAANEKNSSELWSLCEAYLSVYGAQGIETSQNTLKAYKRGVNCLLEHWQHVNLLQPTSDDAAEYIATLASEGKAKATLQQRLASSRLLYKALRWSGALREELEKKGTPRSATATPFEHVKVPASRTKTSEKIKPYSIPEIEAMLAVAEPEQQAMILLGAHGGLRVSVMVNLKWEHINLETKELKVIAGKGNKDRTVIMSDRLVSALERLARTSEKVLPTYTHRVKVYRHVKKICYISGVEFKDVHGLRHTAGTVIQHYTNDLQKTAEHLGHATLDMARNYAAIDREAMKEAVKGAFG